MKGIPLEASIDAIAFDAEMSAVPLQLDELFLRQAVQVEAPCVPSSQNRRTDCSPTPSMSAAACTS